MARGRRRGAAVHRRIVRRRALVRRRDVRAAPPAGRRRTRPRHRSGRTDRTHQLDPRRVHRPHVHGHEAVAPPRCPGRAACAAVGRRAARARAARPPRRPRSSRNARLSRSTRFATPEAFRDYFKANYGPTIAVYNHIADDADQVQALDDALVALAAARPRRHPRRHGMGVPAVHRPKR